MIAQAVKFTVHLCGIVVLSRILGPASVGVVVVATAVIGFAEYFRDFGLSVAAIRERHLSTSHRDALFWTNTALGLCFAAAAWVAAGPLAHSLRIEELEGVVRWLSATFILNGIGAQYRAGLNREHRFRPLAVAESIAPVVGLTCAVAMAALGLGYWSLVGQFLVTAVVSNGLIIGFASWLPGRPRRVSGLGHMYRFGANYAASQVIGYVGNNLDRVALGYWSSPGAAGIYGRAYQLSIGTLDQLKAPATTVAIPLLSHVRNEPQPFLRSMIQGQLLLSYATLPLAAVMVAAGPPGIALVLGSEWASAGAIMSILAVAAALQQLATVASWAFVVSGQAQALRNYMMVSTALKVTAVLLMSPHGPLPLAIGYASGIAICWPLAIRWSTIAAGLPTAPLLLQGLRLLTYGTVAAMLGFLLQAAVPSDALLVRLALSSVGVLGAYAALACLPAGRRDLATLVAALRLALARTSTTS